MLSPLRRPLQSTSRVFRTFKAYERPFSTSPSRNKTHRDPFHPTGVYYHLLPPSSTSPSSQSATWALSLLSRAPSSPSASSIMGLLPGPSETTPQELSNLARSRPELLAPNPDFFEVLHRVLREKVLREDQMLQAEAFMRKSGWAHLSDARHQLMPGRIPTPENILASAAFVDGVFTCLEEGDSGTESGYEINGTYRLITKEEGLIQLQESWLPNVLKAFEDVN